MGKTPRPPLEELIAKTPAAQSRKAADAHIAARRKGLGVNGATRRNVDDSNVGKPEFNPKTPLDYGDPPPRPPLKKTKQATSVNKKKPTKSNIRLVKSDKQSPEDDVK
jgi:hypothetical protein